MKEVFVERQEMFLRIAIKENGILTECYIEEKNDEPKVSNIYKGVVKNIVPSIKSAFIDIGTNKNAYIYLKENLKKGDEVLVEVIKESIGKKGPKVVNNINLPGNYVVITNENEDIRFSYKIKDKDFKELVKENIEKPKGIGVTLRTSASDVDVEVINSEIKVLYGIYENIKRKFTYSNKCGLLYDNDGILGNTIRSLSSSNCNVIVNTEEDFNYCKEILEFKNIDIDIELYDENISLFNNFGIEKEILSLRSNKVNLPSGGNIVIEKTEAMYVVDVNSAKDIKNNIFQTNVEAAKLVASQIRLRNMSGIIIIDFIDLYKKDEKEKILKVLKESFLDDKNKTVIYDFTELNLVQIARRRSGKSIYEYIFESCSTCHGKGVKVKLSYLENMIKDSLQRLNLEQNVKDIYIEIDESYKNQIQKDLISFIKNINGLDKSIYLNYVHDMESFKLEPLIFANQIRNAEVYKIF